MDVAMQDGRRSAHCLAADGVSESLCWGSLAATGISAMLAKYAQALVIMKTLGGAYLLYFGLKAA